MLHVEMTMQVQQEQRRDWLAAAERRRQTAIVSGARVALSRRVAAPLGAALVRLGARLLRYARAEAPTATRPYRASARSIRLN
ncbi:MAG: hypothetical protein ACJ8CR_16510 [Roseiflexaceae bacterium]